MPPDRANSANAAVTASSPLSGRRLISRIAAPLTSKSRTLSDFYIDLAEPHKQYFPGRTVSGSVKLRTIKAVRVTHIVVCLHGFVQVYKTPGAPPLEGHRAQSGYVGTGRGKKSGEYFGNGFASLFEDEVVLCGEGRLVEGQYQFEFNLEFPNRDLPSSIDFERGTISYMISATLTRPTTISPTVHCDHKVYLLEQIDISYLYPPKARTITLEPISRRARTKNPTRRLKNSSERTPTRSDIGTPSLQRRESGASSSLSMRADAETPHSPAPSEVSLESLDSSVGRISQQESSIYTYRHTEGGRAYSSTISLASGTITATVESLVGGCLPGDSVPVKINITHAKHVRSLNGVIITLYRQARVDMRPAIPLGPTEKGKEAQHEDYYPRSMTGLGGLSLSGAGSSHVFRKDLAQVILPLFVDPKRLSAEINGKVHVPEEAFPTISSVPGAIISFRYYVEVVLDVQGKLSSQDRVFGNRSGSVSTTYQPQVLEGLERDRSITNTYGSPIVDTAAIRRDKGVVACTFEVVIGTKDSARRRGKRRVLDGSEQDDGSELQATPQPPQPPQPTHASISVHGSAATSPPSHLRYQGGSDGAGLTWNQVHSWQVQDQRTPGGQAENRNYDMQPPVPMPHLEDESQISEKERLRRAEARLLPSSPPETDFPAAEESYEPTAPYLADEHPSSHVSGEVRSTPTFSSLPDAHDETLDGTIGSVALGGESTTQTPAYEPPGADSSSRMATGDDKNEIQRQQLFLQTSSPPELGEEGEEGNRAPATEEQGPTAPVIQDDDDDLYTYSTDSHIDAPTSTSLPRYEK